MTYRAFPLANLVLESGNMKFAPFLRSTARLVTAFAPLLLIAGAAQLPPEPLYAGPLLVTATPLDASTFALRRSQPTASCASFRTPER